MTQCLWADSRHESDILRLWKQGFLEDTEADIRVFLHALRGEARCMLLQEDNVVCSMAFVIPAVWRHEGVQRCVWYIYAAVTATEYRGKGHFAQLLEEIADRAQKEAVWGLFLRPATPSLFAYYERHGFKTAFYVNEFTCKAKELHTHENTWMWQTVTSHHAVCREYWLSLCGVAHVSWSKSATAYAVELLENGGMLVSSKGMVMYRREKKRVVITELICRPQDREAALSSLARHFACHEMTVVTPPIMDKSAQPYGMFREITEMNTAKSGWYMGFSLE